MTRDELLNHIEALEQDAGALFSPTIGRLARMTIRPFLIFLIFSVSMATTRDWWTDFLGGSSAAANSLIVVLPLAVFVLLWQAQEREQKVWKKTVAFTRLWRSIRDLHQDAGLAVEVKPQHLERLEQAHADYEALREQVTS